MECVEFIGEGLKLRPALEAMEADVLAASSILTADMPYGHWCLGSTSVISTEAV